jgi:hypothetical protein
MFRSLRSTIEYTASCFQWHGFYRVKENHGEGWVPSVIRPSEPLVVVCGKRTHKFALELVKSWCYIEIINPLFFPAYIRLNGRPYILKRNQSISHKQSGRTVIISRQSNTLEQNYYVTVRAD